MLNVSSEYSFNWIKNIPSLNNLFISFLTWLISLIELKTVH